MARDDQPLSAFRAVPRPQDAMVRGQARGDGVLYRGRRRRDRHGPRDVGTLGVGQVIGRALDAAELREDSLSQLAKAFEHVLAARAGLSFPSYRVTCGLPSTGGDLGKKKRVHGQRTRKSVMEGKGG